MEKKRRNLIIAAVAVAAAFLLVVAYSFLPLTAFGHFTSPDENANFFFSRLFARGQVLYYWDPANLFAAGGAFPRSMRVVDDFTVPVGFIGLPVLLGGIGALLGLTAIPFVTPVLSVLGLIGWFLLVGRHFGTRIGAAAAVILAVHPVWWYETARTMQPNVVFLSLLIWSAYFLVVSPLGGRFGSRIGPLVDSVAGGILLGLALAVRTSEVYWIVLAALVIAAADFRKIPWARLVVGAFAATLTLLPFASMNRDLYGSVWRSGYGSVTSAESVAAAGGGLGMKLIGPLQPYLFPLGFAPRTALGHFWSYGFGLIPWWSLAVALSAAWLVWLWRKGRHRLAYRLLRQLDGQGQPRPERRHHRVLLPALLAACLRVFHRAGGCGRRPVSQGAPVALPGRHRRVFPVSRRVRLCRFSFAGRRPGRGAKRDATLRGHRGRREPNRSRRCGHRRRFGRQVFLSGAVRRPAV
jgi:hypothetical protein